MPAAEKTGNLTLKTNAVVHSLIYDETKLKATGVRVIDTITKKTTEYFMWLDKNKKDEWDIPLLHASISWHQNEDEMAKDAVEQMQEMFDKAGLKNIETTDNHQVPGKDIHEMGGCRMGNDPKTSMLNNWNQLHAVPNVFVTDGACMTSSACQNPSLTYMAITARACNYAVSEMKKGNL